MHSLCLVCLQWVQKALEVFAMTERWVQPAAAPGGHFPAAAICCRGAGKCCGVPEPGGDQGPDGVCGERAPRLGCGGGKRVPALPACLPPFQHGTLMALVLLGVASCPEHSITAWRSRAGHVLGLAEGLPCAAAGAELFILLELIKRALIRSFLQWVLLWHLPREQRANLREDGKDEGRRAGLESSPRSRLQVSRSSRGSKSCF